MLGIIVTLNLSNESSKLLVGLLFKLCLCEMMSGKLLFEILDLSLVLIDILLQLHHFVHFILDVRWIMECHAFVTSHSEWGLAN